MYPRASETPTSTLGRLARDRQALLQRTARARVSWRVEVLVLGLACTAALCLFYREVIFENRTFLPFGYPAEVMGPAPPWQFTGTVRPNPYRLDAGGSAWQLEPWARMVGASYKAGALPLWNSHAFFGTPFAGDAQPGTFDVLRLPALLTSHAVGWDVYYLFQAALCLALTYTFARSVGLRREAAILAGLAYTFCGFMFIRGNMHYDEVYHLLPGVLLGIELVIQGASRRGLVIVAAGTALSLLAGMPEVALLCLLYSASYGVFRVLWEAFAQGLPRCAIGRFLMLTLASAAGVALAAPMLVPALEYLPLSYNIHPPGRGLGLIALPARAMAFVGVPYIAGLPTRPLVDGDPFGVDDYSGAAVLVLALVGALSIGRLKRPRPAMVFALLSSVLWGAKVFGVPGINQLGALPLLVQTLIYIFATPLISFSLALLAGAALHVVATDRVPIRTVLAVGFAFAGYLVVAAALHWNTLRAGGIEHVRETLGLAVATGLGALACVLLARTAPRGVAAGAACLVALAELVVLAPRDVYSDRYDSLAQPPFVTWLQNQQAASGQPFRVFSNDGLLYPDYAGAFGIDDPRIVDGLYPSRTWDFVKAFLSPSISDRYVGGWGHPELPTELFGNKWLNFSNVRYILRPADHSPADSTLASWIIAANYPPTDAYHLAEFSISGTRREVLVERTGTALRYRVRPSAERPNLSFAIGLDPNAGRSAQAEFVLRVEAGTQRQVAFDRVVTATLDGDRQWIPGAVDLSPYIGQEVDLVLETRSPDGGVSSAPGWGDLRLGPPPDASQFRQVYSGEISIWENTQALPRALLIANVEPVSTEAEAIARMAAADFDPGSRAVVEGAADAAAGPTGLAGTAHIASYSQQQVQVDLDARQPAILVLTDTYYPGWSATVDGEPRAILPTDVAFRGVEVPAGAHRVVFHYFPRSFWSGVAIAIVGAALLVGLLWRTSPSPERA